MNDILRMFVEVMDDMRFSSALPGRDPWISSSWSSGQPESVRGFPTTATGYQNYVQLCSSQSFWNVERT